MEFDFLIIFRIFCSFITGIMLYQVIWTLSFYRENWVSWHRNQFLLCFCAFVYSGITLLLSYPIVHQTSYKVMSMLSPISAFTAFGLYLNVMQHHLKVKLPFVRLIYIVCGLSVLCLFATSVELLFLDSNFFIIPVDLNQISNIYLKQNKYLFALIGPNLVFLGLLSLIGILAAVYLLVQIFKTKQGFLLFFAVCLNLLCIINDAIFGALMLPYSFPISFAAYSIEISVFTFVLTKSAIRSNFELKKEVAEISKIAEMGAFTAQICHDIRNPLFTLQGNLRYISRFFDPSSVDNGNKIQNKLEKIDNMCLKISDIIHEYLKLIQKDEEVGLQEISLAEIVQEAIHLNEGKISMSNISLKSEVNNDIFLVGHNTRIIMIISNLISNSCDAIKELDERWITVAAKNELQGVKVFVKDSGNGIPEQIQSKIFDRQFSTKDKKLGAGLGLNFVRTIMELYGGSVELNSESKNTEFVLYFPRSSEQS